MPVSNLMSSGPRRIYLALALAVSLVVAGGSSEAFAASTLTPTPTPTITGTAQVGSLLTAVAGTWGPAPVTLAYSWSAAGTAISGATTSTYTPVTGNVGKTITVTVTGSKTGYTTVAKTSTATAAVIAAPVPPAPLLTSVDSVGLGVLVNWIPSDASWSTTSYGVTVTPYTGSTAPGCTNPESVTQAVLPTNTSVYVSGLCAGVVYSATVNAINSSGAGPASPASDPVAPSIAQAPNAPLLIAVTPRDGQLDVNWVAPSYSGGDPVTGYTITATVGQTTATYAATASATSAVLAGLNDGTAYIVSLSATSPAGTSTATTGTGQPIAAYLPGAPSALIAQPDGSGNVSVSWQAPVDTGGDAITGYSVSWIQTAQNSDGSFSPVVGATSHTQTVAGTALSATASVFEAPTALYRFTVAAVTAVGTGPGTTSIGVVTPTVQVKSTTVILTAATVASISTVASSAIVWPLPAPAQAQSLVAGDTIVAGAGGVFPNGIVLDVAATTTTATTLTVSTSQGLLSDAVTNASISTSGDPLVGTTGTQATIAGPQSLVGSKASFVPTTSGVTVLPNDFGGNLSFGNTVTLALDVEKGDGDGCDGSGGCGTLTVEGSVNLSPNVTLGLIVNQDSTGTPDGVSVAASASVAVEDDFTISGSGSFTKQIGEIDGPDTDIQAGPLPIVLVPKIPVFLNVTAAAGAEISSSITVGASVAWSSENPGKLLYQNLSTPFTGGLAGVPGDDVSGSVSVGFEARPEVEIEDVAGPDVEADLDLAAAVDFTPPAGQDCLQLSPQLDLKVGVNLTLFSFDPDLAETISDVPLGTWEFNACNGPGYAITPANTTTAVGSPLTLSAIRSDGQNGTLTWTLVGGSSGDSLSQSGVFTPGTPAGRTVEIDVRDTSGAIGKTTVTVGAAFSPPTSLAFVQSGAQSYAATLTWAPPTSSGGYPVSSYRVVTQPSTGTHSTTATTLTLNGLSSGLYTASVYAINSKGVTSPPATALLQVSDTGQVGEAALAITSTSVPLPSTGSWVGQVPGDAETGELILDGQQITCVGNNFCLAIGTVLATDPNTTAEDDQFPSASTLSNGSWTSTQLPLPSNAETPNPTSVLTKVECPNANSCVAVGSYFDNNGIDQGLLESLSSGVWTATEAYVPAYPAQTNLTDLSCPSAGSCVAIGIGSDWGADDTGVGVSETLSGGTWTFQPLGFYPNAISCETVTSCVAEGDTFDSNQARTDWLETLSGGNWTEYAIPEPTDIAAYPPASIEPEALACSDSGTCVAAFRARNQSGSVLGSFVISRVGGIWSASDIPLSAGTSNPTPFFDATCSPGGVCAFPEVLTSNNNGTEEGGVIVFAKGVWTAQQIAPPSGASGLALYPTSVVCWDSGSCIAVGTYNNNLGTTASFESIYDNGLWKSTAQPAPSDTSAQEDGFANIPNVSCLREGSCETFGEYVNSANLPFEAADAINWATSH